MAKGVPESTGRNPWTGDYYRIAVIAVAILGISVLHYVTSTEEALRHDVYRRLYYFPVALGGIWFGLWGGVGTALAVALLYVPHVLVMWNDMGRELANRLMDVFVIGCLGVVAGYFADTERRLRLRVERTSASLRESYDKLRQQADVLLETEELLRRADRLTVVGQLTADFAHEIRNPLSSVKGAAQILGDSFPQGHPMAEFSEIIVKESAQLNRVVEDYLKLARSGGDGESEERADLAAVAQETAAMLKGQFRRHDVTIQLNTPLSIVVKGSPARVKQVLLNLVLNALQAVGERGVIAVTIRTGTRKVHLSDGREGEAQVAVVAVEDSGPGLSREALEKLFTPFFTTKADGTGLGLAVSRRIAAALGGFLEAENRAEGGARFTLTLPRAEG